MATIKYRESLAQMSKTLDDLAKAQHAMYEAKRALETAIQVHSAAVHAAAVAQTKHFALLEDPAEAELLRGDEGMFWKNMSM